MGLICTDQKELLRRAGKRTVPNMHASFHISTQYSSNIGHQDKDLGGTPQRTILISIICEQWEKKKDPVCSNAAIAESAAVEGDVQWRSWWEKLRDPKRGLTPFAVGATGSTSDTSLIHAETVRCVDVRSPGRKHMPYTALTAAFWDPRPMEPLFFVEGATIWCGKRAPGRQREPHPTRKWAI
jgi:hypothetical protein